MKICKKHWAMLIAAVKERGMWHLVAADGQTAMENTIAELNNEEAPYDPLMACNWMVFHRGISDGGLYFAASDLCPICEAMIHTANVEFPNPDHPDQKDVYTEAQVESFWTNGPADAALQVCQEKGLVPSKQ